MSAIKVNIKFLGAGLVPRPVKLNESQFCDLYCMSLLRIITYYCLNRYYLLLPFLLLHCYYIIITYHYITHYYVLLLFLLLHCYYIIIRYYYVSYYYVLLHFYYYTVIMSLLCIITRSLLPIITTT